MSIKAILQKIEEDPKLQEAMETLQLTEKSFRLMPLFPLLYVAWADGKLQQEEVDKILEIAEENGLTEGDGAGILSVWLGTDKRPSDDFFVSGLRLTAAVLKFAQTTYKNNLVQLCESVAESAGGALGMGSVSGEEKKALVQIAELLDVRGQASYHTLIERMQSELSPEELEWIPSQVSPMWIAINALVTLAVALAVFLPLRSVYSSLVVSAQHETIFLVGFLLLPQLGFFISNVLTARLSAGNTIRESTIGTGISVILVLVIGAFVLGSTTKKYQGFNVSQPKDQTLIFPQCDELKAVWQKQRCVREAKKDGKDICRLMPNASINPAKFPLGKQSRDWIPAADCKGRVSKDIFFVAKANSPKVYSVKLQSRISKGYYPLCQDVKAGTKQACLQLTKHPKEGMVCRVQSSPEDNNDKLGKKYSEWYPREYCNEVYARVYLIWKKSGKQTAFAGYYPICDDIKGANQPCIYLQRVSLPTGKRQRVCVTTNSRTTPLSAIPLAKEPYENWYPLEDCQESGSNLQFGLLFAALGFAIVAFFVSFFGGWVGERWQGTV